MADVTINNLTGQAPSLTDVFPFSTTGVGPTTYKATLSQLKAGMSLNNVENKSSATIRSELTSSNVTTALGYTPYNNTNPAGYITAASIPSSQQLAKAWVNWKGNDYNAQNECTLNATFNISKVVRTGNGSYEVYFSSPSPVSNAYYTIQGGAIGIAGAGSRWIVPGAPYYNNVKKNTSSFTVDCVFTFTAREDASEAWVSVFGN